MNAQALVVDDHPLYREALACLLRTVLEGGEVAMAGSAEDALRRIQDLPKLRLITLDTRLPGLGGVAAVPSLRAQRPDALVAIVSATDERREVSAAFRVGVDAFLSKRLAKETLRESLHRLLTGTIQRPAWVAPHTDGATLEDALPDLTQRQRQIVELLSRGYSNKEIALHLSLAEITVKQHVSSVLRTLRVGNRTQAVVLARELGLAC